MTVTENAPVTTKKYQLVPPDGGWGYLICVGVTINFIATTSFISSFGIVFNDFFIELGMETTDISLLAGINAMSIAFSGFLASPMMKVISIRKLSLLASTIFNIGVIGTMFVKTQTQLIVCQGLLQNFGVGLLFNTSNTALNNYFKEKRLVSLSAVNIFTAAAAIVAPIIVDWTSRKYGFQGTIIFMSMVASTTFIGSALFQPIEWHMKKVEIITDGAETKLLLENSDKGKNEILKTPVIKLPDDEKNNDLVYEEKEYLYDDDSLKGNKILKFVQKSLDWPHIKAYMSACACYGIPICMFTDNTHIFFLPQDLYARNWTRESVAFAFSLLAFGDIATRCLIIFSSSIFKKFGSHMLYVVGLIVGIITKLALIWVTDHTAILVIMTIMGIPRCSITVLFPLVVTESVEPQLFASAMGTSLLIFGTVSIILGPATGAIRDATGNYSTMFYIFVGILAIIAIAMSIEAVVKRKKSKPESVPRK